MATPPHQGRRNHNLRSSSLLELSHDELGVIFDGIADPLEPTVAVALSGTCLGLRTPLLVALKRLKQRRAQVDALFRKSHTLQPINPAGWHEVEELQWWQAGLDADDAEAVGTILRSNRLPELQEVTLVGNAFGDAGVQAVCDGLARGAAPALRTLSVGESQFGPVGAKALAAALARGAMPNLKVLNLSYNPMGDQGVAALVAPLRKLPALTHLHLFGCDVGDDGLNSLVANLGKDDFKALEWLSLSHNEITDAGCAKLVAALDDGALPALKLVAMPEVLEPRVQAALCRR